LTQPAREGPDGTFNRGTFYASSFTIAFSLLMAGGANASYDFEFYRERPTSWAAPSTTRFLYGIVSFNFSPENYSPTPLNYPGDQAGYDLTLVCVFQ
jgi:hypothetical protein